MSYAAGTNRSFAFFAQASGSIPFAFALHHLTYFAGLLAGIARGLLAVAAR